jgi:hypothetical protein
VFDDEEFVTDRAEAMAAARAHRESIAPPRTPVRDSVPPPNGKAPASVRAAQQD